ncbi:MAG: hypothetical protein ACI80V_001455 [Rhodothermales bacterium]
MTRKYFACLLMLCGALPAAAQTSPQSVRVFLDCDRNCDREFIRSEISLVDFVNEPSASDVHLLITSERTGSGGDVFSLVFMGQRSFAALSDTLEFVNLGTNSRDERRQGLTSSIEQGLVRYVARTALASSIHISLVRPAEENSDRANGSIEVDPWNYWVFTVGGNGGLRGEESSDNLSLRGNLSANRTTEDWKIRVRADGRYNEQNFDLDSGTITRTTRSGSLWFFGVKSLGEHWSAGGTAYFNTDSRNNTKAAVTVGPAIEYNVFPYSESTRREFRFQYGVRWDRVDYDEVTIFDLTVESILKHTLKAEMDIKQTWGDVSFDAEFVHLLSNFDRSLTGSYRLELEAGADVRIARGFSVSFDAGYQLIRDQLFLPLSDISDEDVLLGTRRLPTGYEFNVGVGFNYRFGSIYNNVVNPRFGF